MSSVRKGHDARPSGVDSRAGSVDDDGLLDLRECQFNRHLDDRARADGDAHLVVGPEPLENNVEHVDSRRQSRKARLAVVGFLGLRATDQRRRTDCDERTRKDAALFVLDGSDEGAGEALGHCQWRRRKTGDGNPQKAHREPAMDVRA